MKNKTTAGLFAILLGGLGVHKFYLGRTGQGVIYLLLCWAFLPSIIAVIEGIQYLTMSDEEFNYKYNPHLDLRESTSPDKLNDIEKAHQLKEKGLISEEEYEDIKKRNLR